MSLASGKRLGPYEIVRAIGAGGMGKVISLGTTLLTIRRGLMPPDASPADPRSPEVP